LAESQLYKSSSVSHQFIIIICHLFGSVDILEDNNTYDFVHPDFLTRCVDEKCCLYLLLSSTSLT